MILTKRIEALCKLSLVVEENVIQNLSSFSLFFGDMKTIAYGSSLDLYFNSFDLPSYSSVLRIAGEGGRVGKNYDIFTDVSEST